MKRLLLSSCVMVWSTLAATAQTAPTIDQMLNLKWPVLARISPDQHGDKDGRVPVKLVIYKSHDHGIFKPREQRALMEQKFEWFSKYIWREEPAVLARPTR